MVRKIIRSVNGVNALFNEGKDCILKVNSTKINTNNRLTERDDLKGREERY